MQNQIRQFLELLDQSGLPDDRVKFWLARLASDDFALDDEEKFTTELVAHLKTLDDAIAFTDEQIKADTEKLETLNGEAIPYLTRLAADQPAFYEKDDARYKNDVLTAEKDMMGAIEGIRGTKTTEDIEAIRRKLLS
jgi:hypothetical protein